MNNSLYNTVISERSETNEINSTIAPALDIKEREGTQAKHNNLTQLKEKENFNLVRQR